MRATLAERPGALAALAAECGAAGVNILGVQVFPGVEAVTDELVLSTPGSWAESEIQALVGRSGGQSVSVAPCTEAALTDQPTRYVQAARAILDRPASFPEVVAALFDADADPGATGTDLDVMDMTVGEVQVQIRRSAPFTATEYARGSAMADLVSDVLGRERHHPAFALSDNRRMGGGSPPDYRVEGHRVLAAIDGTTVGVASVLPAAGPAAGDETDVRRVELEVDPAWQRRGIGTRLLSDAARLASGLGADAIVLSTRSDNQAVMPMMMAAGMRGRIRMAGDVLTVRIGVRDLRPLSPSRP